MRRRTSWPRGKYNQSYDARHPVICRDKPSKPLRAAPRPPQPARPVAPAGRGRRRGPRPGPRSGRTGARRFRLSPRPGLGCCHGAGRPSRTGDGPVDPPGCGSGCGSRPGYGPPFSFGARPPRSRAHARPGCPVTRRIQIGLQVGSQARPAASVAPVRIAAIDRYWASNARLSGSSRAALSRKDGHALHRPRVGRNRYPAKNGYGAIGHRSSGGRS